jgi:anti-anti-sigma factor
VEISIKEYKRVAVITISGRVDSATAEEFESELTQAVNAGFTNLVLDLAAVDFLSSAGLRVLVTARKKVTGAGGDIRIAQPSEQVIETLELTGLNTLFTTYTDRESAIASF